MRARGAGFRGSTSSGTKLATSRFSEARFAARNRTRMPRREQAPTCHDRSQRFQDPANKNVDPVVDPDLKFCLHVELSGATILEFGKRNLEFPPKAIGFDPCFLTESDIFFHLRLRGAEAIEEIARDAERHAAGLSPDARVMARCAHQ